jgi:sugar phosphate isomerase/epimerase
LWKGPDGVWPLEILPSAIVGGIDGFIRLCERLGTASLGLNFDTGHAWASKENLYLIPAKLGRQIVGTHLCDNFGNENLSLPRSRIHRLAQVDQDPPGFRLRRRL